MRNGQKKHLIVIVVIFLLIAGGVSYDYFNRSKRTGGPAVPLPDKVKNNTDDLVENIQERAQSIKNTLGKKKEDGKYPIHENITSTLFWVGEEAGEDNGNISNSPSAWDERWVEHFGGIDAPNSRKGFFPAKFIPKENPFYVALPYNDFDEKGAKKNLVELAAWGNDEKKINESVCKNRWVKITKGERVVYAQWEDVGPFEENDKRYVFGKKLPKNKTNDRAGIDVSPAVRDFLELRDIDKVSWQFVDEDQVPNGPWKEIVTRSQIFWE